MRNRHFQGYFVIAGTTAELLKLWPVLLKLGDSCPTQLILSGQHSISNDLLRLVGASGIQIRRDKHNRDISKNPFLTLTWMVQAVPKLIGILMFRELRMRRRFGVIVQGDTLTTLFGSIAAKITGHYIFHIEAGYRTKNWKNPFPEEIVRRAVGILADVHYCPTQTESDNILKRGSKIIVTGGNTGLDSLELALKSSINPTKRSKEFHDWYQKFSNNFGVMTLHRFELLTGTNLKKENNLVSEIRRIDSSIGLVILMGTFERAKLSDVLEEVESHNVLFLDKMEYLEFIFLLRNAEFVVTDSGGLAQECNALGIPCFVAREVIEETNLRENTILIGTEFRELSKLASTASSYRQPSRLPLDPSPTLIVMNDLNSHVISQ